MTQHAWKTPRRLAPAMGRCAAICSAPLLMDTVVKPDDMTAIAARGGRLRHLNAATKCRVPGGFVWAPDDCFRSREGAVAKRFPIWHVENVIKA